MRDQLGLPLEYDQLKHGYYYTREVHEFPMLHLSRTDLVALFLARHALEPLRGTRLERMLAESFSKIAEACPGEVSIQWNELDEAFSVKAAGVMPADVTLFGDLLDAVLACREVNFDYHKLTGNKPEQRTVHPYHVGQIEHGWYLLAYDPAQKAVRTFALQRITNLTMLRTKFVRDPRFNARDHLGGGFGVWSYAGEEKRTHEVHIRFESYAARIVAERQWHCVSKGVQDSAVSTKASSRSSISPASASSSSCCSSGVSVARMGSSRVVVERMNSRAFRFMGLCT
jgi:predicted DNA-binding transcriptional regulator YafY